MQVRELTHQQFLSNTSHMPPSPAAGASPAVLQGTLQPAADPAINLSTNTQSPSALTTAHNELLLIKAVLKGVPLFSNLKDKSLLLLSEIMERCTFTPGEIIQEPSKIDDRFHIITRGTVEFLASDEDGAPLVVGKAGSGAYFGECEMLSMGKGILSVRASSDLETLALDRREFETFLKNYPPASLEIARVLADRVTQAHTAFRHHASQNVNELHDEKLTFGERLADKFAGLMGSWKFILTQSAILGTWVALNCAAFINHWDPYPFILLNLVLSFQAAYAAPIIMMSQNRQAQKDRIAAEVDHNVNLKNETRIEEALARLSRIEERLGNGT